MGKNAYLIAFSQDCSSKGESFDKNELARRAFRFKVFIFFFLL